ncbi:hypothetical protein Ancab_037698 [Ancistrocladus abbreviatus]
MRDKPLPSFELEGKVFDLHNISATHLLNTCNNLSSGGRGGGNYCSGSGSSKQGCCFVGDEPTSVLDTRRSPSPSTSTSTLSSSLGGGGGGSGAVGGGSGASTDTAGVAAVSGNPPGKWPKGQQQHHNHQDNNSSTPAITAVTTTTTTSVTTVNGGNNDVNVDASGGSTGGVGKKDEWVLEYHQLPTAVEIGATNASGKCGLGGGMEDWESVLSESSQEPSILGLIMGDVEDSSIGLKQLLPDLDFTGSLGVLDQGFGLDSIGGVAPSSAVGVNNLLTSSTISLPFAPVSNPPQNPIFAPSADINVLPISLAHGTLNQIQNQSQNLQQQLLFSCPDEKLPHLFNPQLLMNQHPAQHMQNPSFFLPLSGNQQDQHIPSPPQSKRHNPGNVGLSKQPVGSSSPQVHLPPHMQQRHMAANKPKMLGEEIMHQQLQQQQEAIIDQLYKAAEQVETGNSVLAHGILARLNHQLSPIGKPFLRAAFYFKEALQLLLMNNPSNSAGSATSLAASTHSSSPFNLLLKIGAYKSFSEILPLVQFANFTCNQALLEALEGFDWIHIVDFDIGYGAQWASFMQELALRKGGAPSLKITALASPGTHDQLELGLTQENLIHFAREINMAFEFEIVSLDYLKSTSWTFPLRASEGEAIAVNLPVGSLCSCAISAPLVLRFVKQLSPKIVVSVDRSCDRTDLPFSNHFLQAFQSYLTLLETLDAVNVNLDALQKIERFLVQPGIESIISRRHGSPEKMQHWRTLFLTSGFSPVVFSNFAECQAEWLLKRTLARGFHVEKRQSSLALYWQRRELISVTAWRC